MQIFMVGVDRCRTKCKNVTAHYVVYWRSLAAIKVVLTGILKWHCCRRGLSLEICLMSLPLKRWVSSCKYPCAKWWLFSCFETEKTLKGVVCMLFHFFMTLVNIDVIQVPRTTELFDEWDFAVIIIVCFKTDSLSSFFSLHPCICN